MQQIRIPVTPGDDYCLLSDVAQLLLTWLPPLWYNATILGRIFLQKDEESQK